MRLKLEPWSPAYDTSSFDSAGGEVTPFADLNLHVELERWQPVQTRRKAIDFSRLYFIDGRRRLESKLFAEWFDSDIPYTAPGLLGVYAVGLAEVDASRPQVVCRVVKEHTHLSRVLILGGDRTTDDLRIEASSSRLGTLVYRCETISESHDKDNALEQKLQALMREAEARVADEVVLEGNLLVIDGPLPLRETLGALGYVKTLHNLMVPPFEQRTLFALQSGQRTPVFLIGGRLDRYSWFLKLDKTLDWHQGLAGVVRLEVHAKNGLEWALDVADWTCQNLPRFCARGFRDPRAPQQLMPVAFLEAELGRRMGDAGIVRRRIQAYLRERYEDEALEPAPTAAMEPLFDTGRVRELN